ncbi:MAG: hypothetical protein AAGC96_18190 [Pseudomonadota bacterium]
MAVQSRAALKSDKDTAFADNTSGNISAGDLRGEFEDLIDSVYIPGEDNTGNTQLMTAAEKAKLSGVETGATQDQTGAEIKALYEAQPDTNPYTDASLSKLAGIEAGATADQTGAEIRTLLLAEADTNILTDARLANIRTLEEFQDLVGAMLQGGTHTNITVNYNDAGGVIDLTGSGGGGGGVPLTQEQVEDFVAGVSTAGSGISVTYDDAANTLTFALTGETYTTGEQTKLAGIAAGATANTGALANLDNVGTGQITDGAVTAAKIAGGAKSGNDDILITGTAGSAGQLAQFNGDGDLVGVSGTDATGYEGILGFDGSGNALDITTRAGLEARITDINYVSAAEARQIENEAQTATSYTLVAADNGKTKQVNNASAVTITIPANATLALSVGFTVNLYQYGAGAVTITAASGVTLNGVVAGSGSIAERYRDLVTLCKVATDEWVAIGGVSEVA